MTSRGRVVLVVVLIVLGITEFSWTWFRAVTQMMDAVEAQLPQNVADQATQNSTSLPPGKGRSFTNAEVYGFLGKAKIAEGIKDPMQRCLAYPDPPGSHWSPDTVSAYCHYRLQPLISFAEAQELIRNGHAAELDRQLADALHAQQTQPESIGKLDRIYQQDFYNGSFDIRPTLDAWKRDSPKSAFAFAASGVAYEAAAGKARGEGYRQDLSQQDEDAVNNLMTLAVADLDRAIALDPAITPAYVAEINAAMINSSRAESRATIERGIKAVPDDYSIYSMAMVALRPMWDGSIADMDALAARAQTRAGHNPLLKILLTERPFFQTDHCHCDAAIEMAAYPNVFDQLPASTHLNYVGRQYEQREYFAYSVIYLSEGLRFEPDLVEERLKRNDLLNNYDESAWGVSDDTALLAQTPGSAKIYRVRGYAYEALNDYAHAEQDYRAALALKPDDRWTINTLADMFVNWSHEWDKGWDITSQMIAAHPDDPYPFVLRAEIQKQQPRAGLKDTVDQFATRFGNDPANQKMLLFLRAQLALQQGPGKQVKAAKAPAHG